MILQEGKKIINTRWVFKLIFVDKDLIIAIYVDDIVIIGRKNHITIDFKKQVNNRFKT